MYVHDHTIIITTTYQLTRNQKNTVRIIVAHYNTMLYYDVHSRSEIHYKQ